MPSPRAEPPSEEGSATPPPAFLAIPLRPADEPEIDSDPSRLFGMAEEDLRRLLGVPQFVRIDGPTRLWRYRAEACLLDLFLYPDETAESPFRVFHFEARGADNGAEPAGSCLEVLLRARPRA